LSPNGSKLSVTCFTLIRCSFIFRSEFAHTAIDLLASRVKLFPPFACTPLVFDQVGHINSFNFFFLLLSNLFISFLGRNINIIMVNHFLIEAKIILQPLRKSFEVVIATVVHNEQTFLWLFFINGVTSENRVEFGILAIQLNLLQLNIYKITRQLCRFERICIWYLSVFFVERRNRYLHWLTFFGCNKLFRVNKYFIDAPAKAPQKVGWLFTFIGCVNEVTSKCARSLTITISNSVKIVFVRNQCLFGINHLEITFYALVQRHPIIQLRHAIENVKSISNVLLK